MPFSLSLTETTLSLKISLFDFLNVIFNGEKLSFKREYLLAFNGEKVLAFNIENVLAWL